MKSIPNIAKDFLSSPRHETKTVIKKDLIVQEITYDYENIRELVLRTIIDTQDEQIKEALIKLGWTPPK